MSNKNPHLSAELLRAASLRFRDEALNHFALFRSSRTQREFWKAQTRQAIKHSRACALAASYLKPTGPVSFRWKNWNERRLALIAARESETAFRASQGIPPEAPTFVIEGHAAQIRPTSRRLILWKLH